MIYSILVFESCAICDLRSLMSVLMALLSSWHLVLWSFCSHVLQLSFLVSEVLWSSKPQDPWVFCFLYYQHCLSSPSHVFWNSFPLPFKSVIPSLLSSDSFSHSFLSCPLIFQPHLIVLWSFYLQDKVFSVLLSSLRPSRDRVLRFGKLKTSMPFVLLFPLEVKLVYNYALKQRRYYEALT